MGGWGVGGGVLKVTCAYACLHSLLDPCPLHLTMLIFTIMQVNIEKGGNDTIASCVILLLIILKIIHVSILYSRRNLRDPALTGIDE